jgi:type VI secretion system protein ImpC
MATNMESEQNAVTTRLDQASTDKTVVEQILDQVAQAPQAGTSSLSLQDEALLLLIKSAAESGGKLQPSGIDQAVASIHKKLSAQTDAILHHPELQKVEATWRGLRHLVENTDFRKGCKISVLDLSKDDLVKDFEDNLDITKTSYYNHIYSNGLGAFRGEPVGAVIANYEFGPGNRDIDLLRKCAQVSAMAHAPFISAASHEMFGVKSFTQIPRLADIKDHFEGARYAAWRGFREEPDARYVGLTMPRFIARPVWSRDSVKSFTYEENVKASHEHFLWGNMAFLFAARLTDAHATYGWCGNIIGPQGGGAVRGMNTYTLEDEGLEEIKIPAEVKLTLRREYELSEAGFIPLIWAENSAEAAFFAAASTKVAKKFRQTPEGDAAAANDFLGTQLPYMFIISRIAHYIKRLQVEQIGSSANTESLQKDIREWIGQYVNPIATNKTEMARKPLKEAVINVTPIESKPGWYEFDVRVTPHFKYMGAHFTLSLVGKMDHATKK